MDTERCLPGFGPIQVPDKATCADVGHTWEFQCIQCRCIPGTYSLHERCSVCDAFRSRPIPPKRSDG